MNESPNSTQTAPSSLAGVVRFAALTAVALFLVGMGSNWLAGQIPVSSSKVDGQVGPAPGDGQPIADFRAVGMDGEMLGPPDYLGKLVVVDFWATWCGPCRLQAKYLEQLHAEVGESGDVEFLAVSLGEDRETVAEFVAKTPFPYPVLLDPEDELTQRYEIYSLPTVMILDRQGRITYSQPGITDLRTLQQELARADGKAPAA